MAGSSAPLRRLGAELRRLREATGRTQADVGGAIGRTHATMVNWELGKTKISKSDLVCLLAELRAPTDVRKDLERLRDEINQTSGQWATYGLPDWLRPLFSFEQDATAVTTFEPTLIPGLLQTEDYARTIHIAGPHITAPPFVERWVAARMQRQQRLAGKNAIKVHALIAESALRLQVSGPTLMVAQLRKVLEVARRRNVTVQVVPAERGAHPAVHSNMTVLHFADARADPPLGYFDGPLGGYLISDPGDVASMISMLDDVRRVALAPHESTDMIAAILEEYQKKGGDDGGDVRDEVAQVQP
ncbi:helix-turn-helix domain-containing protein [Gandjariella thermophila]|uniref:Transcriptional regulator n=1 Tax=Gandjariella thermophila TaxID=1931992 RepID=A0A4D4J540_9PSEU|nr:helix-turn-helix transcriptional regulator [Gandjariella thermophila]GDY30210.1 transcriptional regulator [Gandjariella thermophila]